MTLDPNQMRVRIENVERGWYSGEDLYFDVVVEILDLDTNRFLVVKTTRESL